MEYDGLKRVLVCINNKYEYFNVDNIIKVLSDNLNNKNINENISVEPYNSKKLNTSDYIIIGDTKEDIGLGKNYRGSAPFILYDAECGDADYFRMVWSRKNGYPLIIAETNRILIREMTLKDLDALYELYYSLKDCAFVEPLYERSEETEFSAKYIENMYSFYGYGLWLVFLKENGKLVGRVGIGNREIDGTMAQELGYLIHSDYQKMNIGMESCKEVIKYAKEKLYMKELYSCINKENIPSISLAEKLGFTKAATDIDGINIYYMKL